LILAVFAFQAVPDAPRVESSGQAAPAPAGDSAAPPSSTFGLMMPLLILVPFLLLMFWQSRSQQKKQDALIKDLKKGDRVVTQSGLVGRLLAVEGRYAKLELPPSGTKVTILSSGLVGRDTGVEGTGEASDKPKS
jgi:preprotein translocase subunit YajC